MITCLLQVPVDELIHQTEERKKKYYHIQQWLIVKSHFLQFHTTIDGGSLFHLLTNNESVIDTK